MFEKVFLVGEFTVAFLKQHVSYDPETGIFVWLSNGKRADIPRANGYRGVQIETFGTARSAHRLAWLYMNGKWPENDIDHINGDRADNRITNLRDVSVSVNLQNQKKAHIDSKSGLLGVTKARNKWRAGITVNGKPMHLGYFSSKESAYEAYLSAKRVLHIGNTL
jgi:HNH endonuclease